MRLPRATIASGLASVLSVAAPAPAQDLAAAEALFNRGLADMQSGQYETGCPALGESHRLDPRPGRLFTLAECEAMWGRLATASARYGDYLALFDRLPPSQQVKQHGREKIAAAKKAELAPLIPELTLMLPAGAPDGTVVRRDGIVLERPSLGIPLPTDPGAHVVTTQAPGGPVTETRITLDKGEKKSVTLDVKEAPAPTPPRAPIAAPAQRTATPPAEPPQEGNGRRVGAFIAGGIGVAGLAVGGVFGGLALSRSADASESCQDRDDGVALCDHDGKVAGDSAKTLGLVSTIGFGVGLAGLGAAAVLLLTAPEPTGAASNGRRPPVAGRMTVGLIDSAGEVGVGIRGAW